LLPRGEERKSPVTIILDDGSEYDRPGSLEFSDVTVNPTTGTVTLRAIVANPDQALLPGMFVRARIEKGLKPNSFLLPAVSISRNSKGQAQVMVITPASTVEKRIITTGQNIGDRVLVLKGLAAGERVVVSGLQKIKAGAVVKVAEKKAKTAVETASSQPGAQAE
jgi:membrane fusion protein (multidrug efflux system)